MSWPVANSAGAVILGTALAIESAARTAVAPHVWQRQDPARPEAEDRAPHYHGHRERLRQRFRDAGSEAVTDYELLELVLFRALPDGI